VLLLLLGRGLPAGPRLVETGTVLSFDFAGLGGLVGQLLAAQLH